MAHYPVGHGIVYYSEMDVPGYPVKMDGITYFIYFNIFFSGKGHGRMNQFVPQLMLGNPLCNSTGPPDYKPKWEEHKTWVFGSQYFMEINNTKTNKTAEGHAATGELFEAKVGEVLYTKFELSKNWVWTLTMGVKGDTTRISTVVADKPFMGLVPESTTSWSEKEYQSCNVNSCWELYGVKDQDHFPSSGGYNDMRITTTTPGAIDWKPQKDWNAYLEDGKCATATMNVTESSTRQDAVWVVDPHPDAAVDSIVSV